ncbi:hypothetical protein SAMN05446935_7998 [Burkholderia sp. YR290]|nr:hypothetical protein SAMN05446935_7998 [Burkholderia sp. YR290]
MKDGRAPARIARFAHQDETRRSAMLTWTLLWAGTEHAAGRRKRSGGWQAMAEYLSAIFRSYRDACDARQSLDESDLCEAGALLLFPLAPPTRAPRPVCAAHELDHAEYAAHGEQIAITAINRFMERDVDCFVSDFHEDSRPGHTLLVAAHPPASALAHICDVLKNCGAFAIRLPRSRWRLCLCNPR